jgi:hypothetical protein
MEVRTETSIDLPDLIAQLYRPEIKEQVYAEGRAGLSRPEIVLLTINQSTIYQDKLAA